MEHSHSIKKRYLANILYTIGAFLFTTGILVSFALKTSALTGVILLSCIAIMTFVAACLLHKKQRFDYLSQVIFVISAVLAPIGSILAIYVLNIHWFDLPIMLALAAIKYAVIFGIALHFTKKYILHVLVGFFITASYFLLVLESIKGSGLDLLGIKDVFALAGIILGILYFIYSTLLEKKHGLSRVFALYGTVSTVLILGSALFLGGAWNIIYALLLVGMFFLSINMSLFSALMVSALFSILYILKLVIWYYPFSFSWSIVFILAGLLLLLFGYLTFYLKQKYIYDTPRI